MKNEITIKETPLVDKKTLTTTSSIIAERFGKRPADVLRKIRSIEEDHLEFWQRNFAPRDYVDSRGKTQVEMTCTKDGFMFLVMGFSGKEAGDWKITFINEYNRLEESERLLQNIVWDYINGKKLVGQTLGCSCANIKNPNKLVQFIKEDEVAFKELQDRGMFKYRQVGKHRSQKAWCWNNRGFHWLVQNRDYLNDKVDRLILVEKAKKENSILVM